MRCRWRNRMSRPPIGWLHIALGAAVGVLGATVLRIQAPRRQMLVLSCAFGNVGSLPFVLSGPIVQNYSRARAAYADEAEALSSSSLAALSAITSPRSPDARNMPKNVFYTLHTPGRV